MFMKIVLILAIVATISYIIAIVNDADRFVFVPTERLLAAYSTKPTASNKRVVIVLECRADNCQDTIKSLLDQSVRVDDIAIETERPDLLSKDVKRVVSVHKPGTAILRETESDTIVLILRDSVVYDYDFVETQLKLLGV